MSVAGVLWSIALTGPSSPDPVTDRTPRARRVTIVAGMSDVQRWDYGGTGLEGQVPPAPWELVHAWVEEARAASAQRADLHEPSAMAVASVDADGVPDVRTVLLRFLDPRGPGFVSSRDSAKAAQLEATGVVAATLTWSPLFRAIRVRGRVEIIDAATTDAYWHSRPWGSRISARASRQSHPIGSREELEEAAAAVAREFPDRGGQDVPVPPDWVGYRIVCTDVELWAGRRDRLHDRVRYHASAPARLDDAAAWRCQRLQP